MTEQEKQDRVDLLHGRIMRNLRGIGQQRQRIREAQGKVDHALHSVGRILSEPIEVNSDEAHIAVSEIHLLATQVQNDAAELTSLIGTKIDLFSYVL